MQEQPQSELKDSKDSLIPRRQRRVLDSRASLTFFSATNYGERLDKALFRRFDDLVEFGLPATEQVRQTVKNLLRNIKTERLSWAKIEQAAAGSQLCGNHSCL